MNTEESADRALSLECFLTNGCCVLNSMGLWEAGETRERDEIPTLIN